MFTGDFIDSTPTEINHRTYAGFPRILPLQIPRIMAVKGGQDVDRVLVTKKRVDSPTI